MRMTKEPPVPNYPNVSSDDGYEQRQDIEVFDINNFTLPSEDEYSDYEPDCDGPSGTPATSLVDLLESEGFLNPRSRYAANASQHYAMHKKVYLTCLNWHVLTLHLDEPWRLHYADESLLTFAQCSLLAQSCTRLEIQLTSHPG